MAYPFFAFNNLCSTTVQGIVDDMMTHGDVEAVINAGGYTHRIALDISNFLMTKICAVNFPHKWNSVDLPPIYSTSFQQDYAIVNPAGLSGTLTLTAVSVVSAQQGTTTYVGTISGGDFGGWVGVPFVVAGFVNGANNGTFMCVASSAGALVLKNVGVVETHAGTAISAAGPLLNLSWLERGIAFDINNSAQPKPYVRIEVGRQLPQRTAQYSGSPGLGDPGFRANWFPNHSLYYGTWGAAQTGNGTLGNNPVANSVYTDPISGNISQPKNPITQIKDANNNLLLLTGFGTEGSAAPLAPINATPGTTVSGTGATTVWTVLDPNGWGLRFVPVPSITGTQWQFNVTAQMKPVRFVDLSQTLAPLPDELDQFFREGFLAQLYKRSSEKSIRGKFQDAWKQWEMALHELRVAEDRELEENKFIVTRTVFGAARSRNNFQGGAWPFNYPRA